MLNLGFYNTTAQEMIAFQDVLFSAGFTPADMASVVEEPSLASLMHAAIKPQHFVPEWYISPEQQLERARQLWPDAVLPEPPEGFTPRTRFEVLLLHVPESLDSLWDKVVAPEGYTKEKQECYSGWRVKLAPRKREYTEPIWLAFDPERGKNEPSNSFWDSSDVATTEIISAMIQFPLWPLAWGNGASAPHLVGYQVDGSERVPFLVRLDEEKQLTLCWHAFADLRSFRYANPSVRDLTSDNR